MEITRIHIDGFGHFNNQEWDLEPGLTVFYGPNEAGKSTLLNFVQGILFGFLSKKRSALIPYRPIHTNTHGGYLGGTLHGVMWKVARDWSTTKESADFQVAGRSVTEGDWNQRLHQTDRELFNSVFAFNLQDLFEFKKLTQEKVSDQIFSAGVVGAGKSARAAIDNVVKQKDNLYKSGARSVPQWTKLNKDLSQKKSELTKAQRSVNDYKNLVKQEKREEKRVVEIKTSLDKQRKNMEDAQRLLSFWTDYWAERVTKQQLLDTLAPHANVTPEIAQRLDTLESDLARVARDIKQIEADREDAVQTQSASTFNALWITHADTITRLQQEINTYLQRVEKLQQCRSEHLKQSTQLQRHLAALGENWNTERLRSFPTTIAQNETVRQWEQKLHTAEEAVKTAKTRLDERHTSHEEAQHTATRTKEAVTSLEVPPTLVVLEERERALVELHHLCGSLAALDKEIETLTQTLQQQKQTLTPSPSPSRAPLLFPLISGVLALLAVWRGMQYDPITATTLGVIAVALLGFWWQSRRSPVSPTTDTALQTTTEAKLTEIRTQREETATRIENLATAVGLSTLPSLSDIELARLDVNRSKESRTAYESAAKADAEAADKLKIATQAYETIQQTYNDAYSFYTTTQAEWTAWRESNGVAHIEHPDGVIECFSHIQAAQAALEQQNTMSTQEGELQVQIHAYLDGLNALLAALSSPVGDTTTDIQVLVNDLAKTLQQEQTKATRYQNATEEHEKYTRQLATLIDEQTQLNDTYETLLLDADVADRTTFNQYLEEHHKRQEAQLTIEKAETQFASRFGTGSSANATRALLKNGDPIKWQQDIESSQQTVNQLETDYELAVIAFANAQRDRTELEASTDITRLSREISELEAELDQIGQEWCLMALTQALLDETLNHFETTHQPQVLTHAKGHFSTITDGRYPELKQLSSTDIQIIDRNNQPFATTDLSRGTAEQLYLCLRFGLAEHLSTQQQLRLPFVLDDILVNFDRERAQRTLDVIREVANTHQVLMFTCHPHIVENIRKQIPDAHVVDL